MAKLMVGYNYPCPSNKFGNWIGPRDREPRNRWPANYADIWKELEFKKQIRDNLHLLQDNGVEVVRWFLLGNGFNYGSPPNTVDPLFPWGMGGGVMRGRSVPPEAPLIRFDPPDRLDPLFLDHF